MFEDIFYLIPIGSTHPARAFIPREIILGMDSSLETQMLCIGDYENEPHTIKNTYKEEIYTYNP